MRRSCAAGASACRTEGGPWAAPALLSRHLLLHLLLASMALLWVFFFGGTTVAHNRLPELPSQKSSQEANNADVLNGLHPELELKETVTETAHASLVESRKSENITAQTAQQELEVEQSADKVASVDINPEVKSEGQVQNEGSEDKSKSEELYVVRAQRKVVGQERAEEAIVREAEPKIKLDDEVEEASQAEESVPTPSAEDKETSETVLMPPPVIPPPSGNVTFDDEGTRIIDPVTENAVTEDIPSFSEWAQKQLAEAEKKKGGQNTTGGSNGQSRASGTPKLRSKNYASPDCGAKIIAANVESQNPSAVISPSRDEYMLNVCTNKVWFVIELCEGIQAKKIEIANFELFSSSPRDFVVSISDRYPTRDWRSVGAFTAEDERNVQNFSLSQHLFGKFVKVELNSHYGSEHYCPVSLFRVYGASEYEVLDTEDEHAENVIENDLDDDDETLGENASSPSPAEDFGGGNQQPQNLFGSARDAVMSIVKKAAQALVKGGDKEQRNQLSELEDSCACNRSSCVTPLHEIICYNCSMPFYDRLFDYFSCSYQDLLKTKLGIWDLVRLSGVCHSFGLQLPGYHNGMSRTSFDKRVPYIMALLSQEYLAALCNVIAEEERKLRLNWTASGRTNGKKSDRQKEGTDSSSSSQETPVQQETCLPESIVTSTKDILSSAATASPVVATTPVLHLDPQTPSLVSSPPTKVPPDQMAIQPTKTLKEEEALPAAVPSVEVVHQPLLQTKAKGTSSVAQSSEGSATVSVSLPRSEELSENSSATDAHEGEKGAKAVPVKPAATSSEGKHQAPSGKSQQKTAAKDSSKKEEVILPVIPQQPPVEVTLDSLLSEVEATMEGGESSSAVPVGTMPIVQQGQKESVFVRLSNKIKALELNLSLSSQYLEELSRRYKKQMEELQKALNKTSAAANDTAKQTAEWQKMHWEGLHSLQGQVENLTQLVHRLTEDRDTVYSKLVGQHLFLFLVELVVVAALMRVCLRRQERRLSALWQAQGPYSRLRAGGGTGPAALNGLRPNPKKKSKKDMKGAATDIVELPRRKSVEGVSGHHLVPSIKPRRPSEEALNISGTYENLLIVEPLVQPSLLSAAICHTEAPVGAYKKRRKRRKELRKSASSANLHQPNGGSNGAASAAYNCGEAEASSSQQQFPAEDTESGISLVGSFKGLGAPPGLEEDWWDCLQDNSRTWHGFPQGTSPAKLQALVVARSGSGSGSGSSSPSPATAPVEWQQMQQPPLTNGLRKESTEQSSRMARGKAKAESGLKRILHKIF